MLLKCHKVKRKLHRHFTVSDSAARRKQPWQQSQDKDLRKRKVWRRSGSRSQ